jgi:hypothetical protein
VAVVAATMNARTIVEMISFFILGSSFVRSNPAGQTEPSIRTLAK